MAKEQTLDQALKKRRAKKRTWVKIALPATFWIVLATIVYLIPPENQTIVGLFFLLLGLSLFTTFRLLTTHLAFTFITTFLIILGLLLRHLRLENPLNLSLIGLISILSFIYLKMK